MSEKKVKAERKIQDQTISIQILAEPNGQVRLSGRLPANFTTAMRIMGVGTQLMAGVFIEHAKHGKLDAQGNIVESPIIQPVPKLIIPQG